MTGLELTHKCSTGNSVIDPSSDACNRRVVGRNSEVEVWFEDLNSTNYRPRRTRALHVQDKKRGGPQL